MRNDTGGTNENAWPEDAAIRRYEVVAMRAPAFGRQLRSIATLVVGAVSQGDVYLHPGGERTIVRDRASGTTVGSFKQGFADDFDMTAHLNKDLISLTADEFESKWLKDL